MTYDTKPIGLDEPELCPSCGELKQDCLCYLDDDDDENSDIDNVEDDEDF